MADASLLVPEAVLTGGPSPELMAGAAVLVRGSTIAAVGPEAQLAAAAPQAERIALPGQLVMPGLVNAHQHGRGLTQIQLGYADDLLELWMNSKRRRAQIDPYPSALLASMNMIANGVTAAVHANTTNGWPDFAAELESFIGGYAATGLKVMIGVGMMDRAALVYPAADEAAFAQTVPQSLRHYASTGGKHYAGDAAATVALLHDLRRRHAANPRLSFAYAPAGPQWVSDGLYEAVAADAAANGVAIHMHGLESFAQATTLARLYPEGFLRRLERLGVLGPLTSIAHGVWLSADDVSVAVAHAITLVRNPGSNLRLRAGIAPLAHYLARGMTVAIGTDNTSLADDEDLLKELRLAARLARSPHWDDPPPPTPAQLVAMATANGWRVMGRGNDAGLIAAGAPADLIAVSLDRVRGAYLDPDMPLLYALLARAEGRDVRLTMVDGTVLYRDGHFPHLDPAQIERGAREAAARSREGASEAARRDVDEFLRLIERHYGPRAAPAASRPWRPLAEQVFPS